MPVTPEDQTDISKQTTSEILLAQQKDSVSNHNDKSDPPSKSDSPVPRPLSADAAASSRQAMAKALKLLILNKRKCDGKRLKNRKYQRPTIAIVGLDPKIVAQLNLSLIKIANEEYDLKDDQQIPDIVAIGARPKSTESATEDLINYAKICRDYGCDILAVVPKMTAESRTLKLIKELGPFQNSYIIHNSDLEQEEDRKEFARKILDKCCQFTKEDSAPNKYDYDAKALSLTSETLDFITQDQQARQQRTEISDTDYKRFFHNSKINTIIGGAGPSASACFCLRAADENMSFLHISLNGTPGKYRFETDQGPSYVPYYKSLVSWLEQIGVDQRIIIPCNTAHQRLDEYFAEAKPSLKNAVIDYRHSSIENFIKNDKTRIIILGTNSTVGVDAGGYCGIYQEYKDKHFSNSKLEFVKTNKEQQQRIMDAIYLVKAGEYKKAQEIISGVIKEIKSIEENKDCFTFLACTELPISYGLKVSPLTYSEEMLLDPSVFAIKKSQTQIEPSQDFRNSEVTNPILAKQKDQRPSNSAQEAVGGKLEINQDRVTSA